MKSLLIPLSVLLCSLVNSETLEYAEAPVDNPLKGLVPYSDQKEKARFPHSMEFSYFPMNKIMLDWGKYDWAAIENLLETARARGNQAIFRIYAEYPGKESAVPNFLLNEGVTLTTWKNQNEENQAPDYQHPKLRQAMVELITAMGKKYDGDPRIGFITAGFLGHWGEWHNYPRADLWAAKEVQNEILDAYEKAFTKTHIVLRYPAGDKNENHTSNNQRNFGYHDDAFCWSTLDSSGPNADWSFVRLIKNANASDKWKTHPIGGEIIPELWATTFTNKPHPKEENFLTCIQETHASWLMDTGLFSDNFPLPEERKNRALKEVRQMGYELYVSKAEMQSDELVVTVENRGIAPFYYDWPIELTWSAPNVRTQPINTDWKLTTILPGKPVEWRIKLSTDVTSASLRIPNPMQGGKALRFANKSQNENALIIY